MTDVAGVFPSDTHRRVLGHLSVPDDDYGWTVEQLVDRMQQDRSTSFTNPDQLVPYLLELRELGDAQEVHRERGMCWQMTPEGFARLTGEAVERPKKQKPVEIVLEPQAKRRWGRFGKKER